MLFSQKNREIEFCNFPWIWFHRKFVQMSNVFVKLLSSWFDVKYVILLNIFKFGPFTYIHSAKSKNQWFEHLVWVYAFLNTFRSSKIVKNTLISLTQCRYFRIFLSLRYYVKSSFKNLEVLKMPFFSKYASKWHILLFCNLQNQFHIKSEWKENHEISTLCENKLISMTSQISQWTIPLVMYIDDFDDPSYLHFLGWLSINKYQIRLSNRSQCNSMHQILLEEMA